MKKIVLFFFLIAVSLSFWSTSNGSYLKPAEYSVLSSSEKGLVVEFRAPDYKIVQLDYSGGRYDFVDIPGTDYLSVPGKARLPVLHILIGIPSTGDLEVKILSEQARELHGEYFPLPSLEPEPLESDLQPGKWMLPEHIPAKSIDPLYPEESVRIGDIAWLRDQRLARIDYFPVQYDYRNKSYIWNSSVKIEIRFLTLQENYDMGEKHELNHSNLYNVDESILRGTLVNYAQALQWRTNPMRVDSRGSALSTDEELPGNRYKIPIRQDGIYRLSYTVLQEAGIPVASLNPTTFKMNNQGDEVGIYVQNIDGNEQIFSPGEAIIFYGQKFYGDRLAALYADEAQNWLTYHTHYSDGTYGYWSPHFNAKMLEKYTDTNVYWLSYGDGPGLRMGVNNGAPGGAPVLNAYTKTVHFEENINWKTTTFTGEDTWFGDLITVNTTNLISSRVYFPQLTSILNGPYNATVRGEVVANTFNGAPEPDHHTQIYLNDPGRTQAVIDTTWHGKSRYHFEAQLPQTDLVEGQNRFEFVVNLLSSAQNVMLTDQIYFDWFEIEYQRALNAESNQLDFFINQPGPKLVEMGDFTITNPTILDVSDPLKPNMVIGSTVVGDKIRFQVVNGSGARYHAGELIDIDAPGIESYNPPDFSVPAEYIVITHHDLIPGVTSLVNHRESQDLSTKVVDIEDLYNQFNFGIYHPIAIKNFLKYTFSNWGFPPTYVVLIGDGHWNFKGYDSYNSPQIFIPPNLVWVDPWQGEVDSANLLATVVGDDPLPDVHISRMPVNNLAELSATITKILQYEQSNPPNWQNHLLFVADNVPDPAGDFVALSEGIIADHVPPTFYVDRVYQNDYGCTQYPCPLVTDAIINTLNNQGALFVNFTGHASVNRWSGERVLTNADIPRLSNSNKLPVILSMTCLDGYWSHPGVAGSTLNSLIEELIRSDAKGAVAAFSPTGLGVSTGHDALNRGFYRNLFQEGVWELGTAALAAKVELFSTGENYDLLHTFTVFGDPAMKILPRYETFIPMVKK